MTLNDALEGYWLTNRRNLSPATVDDYSRTFRRLHIYLSAHQLPLAIEDITPAHVNAFLNHLAGRGLSRKTQLNVWVALSSFWTWANNTLELPHIIRHVPRPRPPRIQPQPYTADEIRRLLDAADYTAPWAGRVTGRPTRTRRATSLRDRAMMLVLLDTGMRASEICALRIDDYDRRAGKLVIRHGKGDKARVVYIGQATRQALWRYIQDRVRRRDNTNIRPNEPLFATNTNQHMDRSQLLRMIRNCGQRAGVANVNVHRFRHTCAITMLRNGANALVVQEVLGHVDMSTIRIYVRIAEVDLEHAMRIASPVDIWRL